MIILYHGSQHIIKRPTFGSGNPYNDYGLGFYCTESLELAKEWACTEEENGYANKYEICLSRLRTLDLSGKKYNILNWLALLLNNRIFRITSDVAKEGRDYLSSNFLPNIDGIDVIIGYRANDSYFSFANAFLNNTISLEQLSRAMYLGKLGLQMVLKSEAAFEALYYLDSIAAEKEIYYPSKASRDLEARESYKKERATSRASDSVYLIDILRGEWKNDDPRLQ